MAMRLPDIVVHNALLDVVGPVGWELSETRTEPRFPARNLPRGTPGLVARFRADRPLSNRLLLLEIKPQMVDRVALLNTNILSAPGLAVGVAPDWQTLLAGDGSYYLFAPNEPPLHTAWISIPRASVGAVELVGDIGAGLGSLLPPTSIVTEGGAPIQIGSMWVGDSGPNRIPYGMVWGSEAGVDQIGTYAETEIGAPLGHGLAERRVWSGTLPTRLSASEAAQLRDVHRALRGRSRSALWITDRTSPGSEIAQVRLASDEWRRRAIAPGIYGVSELVLLEEPWGETGV